MKLLSTSSGNPKILKSEKGTDFRIADLSLWPNLSICPGSTAAGCFTDCLKISGRGQMSSVQKARMRKTELWMSDRPRFLELLFDQIHRFIKSCKRSGHRAAARLNVLSDIPWEKFDLFQSFPELFGYDYTKRVARLGTTPKNYKLIFSYSGAPNYQGSVTKALKTSAPLAVVFRGGFPKSFLGREVIDGDASDLVNVRALGKVVGLKVKGAGAKRSKSPFFIDNPELLPVAA